MTWATSWLNEKVFRTYWLAKKIPLTVNTAFFEQVIGLLLSFYSFRYDFQRQCFAHGDNRIYNRIAIAVAGYITDKRTINFSLLMGKPFK